tara:strand:+ start:1193 stop:1579 length:387 start_codon:yes stop_codon:yes gene_type:complete
MNFLRRLGWYAIGMGLGILLVIFLFKDRDFQCTYLPNNRVLVDLNDQKIKLIELDSQSYKFLKICQDSSFIESFLIRGNIDFGKSKVVTREDIKYSQYPIELFYEGVNWNAIWERRDDTVALIRLQKK